MKISILMILHLSFLISSMMLPILLFAIKQLAQLNILELMLVWFVSTIPYLLILLLALTCPKGEVGANAIISR